MNIQQEFNRQVNNLLEKNYPLMAGISEENFMNIVSPLKKKLQHISVRDIDFVQGHLPFVIVIGNALLDPAKTMKLTRYNNTEGIEKMFPHTPNDFKTIEAVNIPSPKAYLLIDIDRGKETLNLPPNQAMEIILDQNRTPLTIEEGIAIITQFPTFLMRNNCFSLLASRVPGNKRVPAIWINKDNQANLGWCWDGNPHTWLGSASCKTRVG